MFRNSVYNCHQLHTLCGKSVIFRISKQLQNSLQRDNLFGYAARSLSQARQALKSFIFKHCPLRPPKARQFIQFLITTEVQWSHVLNDSNEQSCISMRTQNTTNIQLPPKLFSHLPTSMRKEEEIITSVLVTTTNILKALKRLYNCTVKEAVPITDAYRFYFMGLFHPFFPYTAASHNSYIKDKTQVYFELLWTPTASKEVFSATLAEAVLSCTSGPIWASKTIPICTN